MASIKINGTVYKNLRDCCNSLGIDSETFYKARKIFSGSNQELILKLLNDSEFLSEVKKTPSQREPTNRVTTVAFGIKYASLIDCCRAHNISVSAVRTYKSSHPDMNIEEVLNHFKFRETNTRGRGIGVGINGVRYRSIKECCASLNLSYNSVLNMRRDNPGIPINKIIEHKLKEKDNK